jgi:putative ABC transport system permease protein
MSVTWRKVWRDMFHKSSRARTALVALSIAVGVFAIGMLFGAHEVMNECLLQDHLAWGPIHITFWGWFPREIADAVLRTPGVVEVERQVDASFRWRLDGETDWREGDLMAREDYEAQRMGKIELIEGDWPTSRGRTLAVERMSSRHFGVPLGTEILVQVGQRVRQLTVTGIVRDSDFDPPQFGGSPAFFADPETVAWLTGGSFNRLDVRIESHSRESAREVADLVRDRLEDLGVPAGGTWIRDPEEHWVQETVDTTFVILTVLGALALAMSIFLIVNTVNAILAQQIRQIGVMKVVGATSSRVVQVYLAAALVYGGLSLLIAVPLGVIGAHLLAKWVLGILNISQVPFRAVPLALGIQFAVGAAVPLLAALVPVLGGARMTPHEAIGNYGLEGRFGRGWFDRLLGRVRHLPRPMALSLRNTFRHKARVALTLATLALGGVTFMMVMSAEASFEHTVEVLADDFGFDVIVVLDRPYRVTRLTEATSEVPGVEKFEVWDRWWTMLKLDDGDERQISIWGLPPGSDVSRLRIVSGRGLLPGDEKAIVLNHKIAVEEGIEVGDQVRFSLGGEDTTWTVVGVVLNANNGQRDCFAPINALAREAGIINRGWMVAVVGKEHSPECERQLIQDLRDVYAANRIETSRLESASEERASMREEFEIFLYLLVMMAMLAATVGGMGIMSTMSINVIERRREIGVMRATGATSPAIAGIFVGEGILLGILSWLVAVPVSLPGARLFSDIIGETLLDIALDFTYSIGGMVLWLATAVVLSGLASLWPAIKAAGVSVREVLAYE